ncbi:MAG: type II toxin-antitoxin system Phd/YefM family antitoxin [Gammaproteobacteria bacterium]|nr:type II toxin-antitoxin system Phd/YefM family antitoxin [Gammaproteobacteria bacterium]MDH5628781.1 type II toxin-antitoxin system Phd/YefM family antitoxin [Gammaproteobacteria bacterium]
MKKVQVGEFKARFSDIIKQVKEEGQEYLVSYGKRKEAAAVLIPVDKYIALSEKRKFGLLENKGSFSLASNFKMDDEEFLSS